MFIVTHPSAKAESAPMGKPTADIRVISLFFILCISDNDSPPVKDPNDADIIPYFLGFFNSLRNLSKNALKRPKTTTYGTSLFPSTSILHTNSHLSINNSSFLSSSTNLPITS